MHLCGVVWLAVDKLLDVKKGDPPPEAKVASELLMFFVLEGAGQLGEEAPKALVEGFNSLFATLGGFLYEGRMTHYCARASCCPNGRADSIKR